MALAPGGRVYGAALVESAQAAGRLHEVARDLAAIGAAVAESRELAGALYNPAFPDAAKKQILAQMSEGADPLVRNALLVLVDNDRLDALADVVAVVARRRPARAPPARARAHDRGRRSTTPRPSRSAPSSPRPAARRSRSSAPSTPSILGGVIVRVRDRLVDLSVRGRLEALRLSLRNARLGSTGGES